MLLGRLLSAASARITFFRPMSVRVGSGVHSAVDRKLGPEFLEHGLRLEIGGPERDGLAVAERPVVNDLDDRVGPSNADVEYRHDVAILGNDGIVAEPREVEHVGNTWQYVVTEETLPRRVGRPREGSWARLLKSGCRYAAKLVRWPWTPALQYSSTT